MTELCRYGLVIHRWKSRVLLHRSASFVVVSIQANGFASLTDNHYLQLQIYMKIVSKPGSGIDFSHNGSKTGSQDYVVTKCQDKANGEWRRNDPGQGFSLPAAIPLGGVDVKLEIVKSVVQVKSSFSMKWRQFQVDSINFEQTDMINSEAPQSGQDPVEVFDSNEGGHQCDSVLLSHCQQTIMPSSTPEKSSSNKEIAGTTMEIIADYCVKSDDTKEIKCVISQERLHLNESREGFKHCGGSGTSKGDIHGAGRITDDGGGIPVDNRFHQKAKDGDRPPEVVKGRSYPSQVEGKANERPGTADATATTNRMKELFDFINGFYEMIVDQSNKIFTFYTCTSVHELNGKRVQRPKVKLYLDSDYCVVVVLNNVPSYNAADDGKPSVLSVGTARRSEYRKSDALGKADRRL